MEYVIQEAHTCVPLNLSVWSIICNRSVMNRKVNTDGQQCLLYLTLYIIYKIKVMFLQNWYPREASLLFTGRQMLCSMSVRKCIRFCIPELQSWSKVKNTNMKFMKTQDKNTQISVYCIQYYCKYSFGIIKQLLPRENNTPRVNNYDVHLKCRQ